MTDPVVRPSLLPRESTPREQAIEAADAAIADIDAGQIIRARDVAIAPAVYLPDLAWERSVDVYDPAWSDAVKRAVIEAAPEVHRHKGTVYAVKTALSALGVDATISEWWQASPRGAPYTFHVSAFARARLYDGPLLDARLIRVVFASVLHAKPESRAFDLTVAATFPARLGLAPVAVGRSRTAVAMHPANFSRELVAPLGLAPVAIARSRIAVAMQPVSRRALAAPLGLAPVAIARSRIAVAMQPFNRRALAAPLGLGGAAVARVRVAVAFDFMGPS